MDSANSTQIGLSCETVPSSETAVPPRFTAAVKCWQTLRIIPEARG